MHSSISKYLNQNTEAAPLAVFRILFGLMMLLSIIRFWANGWIKKLYLDPDFHFTYYGFSWVQPLGNFTYVIFALCALAALGIALGYRYRWSVLVFFLSFTYIELMDKTTYLNHYYFITCLSFLMLFLEGGAYFSLDAYRKKQAFNLVPKWNIDSIKLLLGIVYFYAGLAKLNSDWLLRAMPLKIWLPSKYDLPFLGNLMQQEWVHYSFSWFGAIYDLSIPFLLLYKPTRKLGFILVVIFHVLTRVLFPIGMFPYIMIVSALIFFDAGFHKKIIALLGKTFRIKSVTSKTLISKTSWRPALFVVGLFFIIQLLLPWRYLLYPGELFWTEEGYRFSWRVMLMEKAGYAQFKVVDQETGKNFYVDNSDFLTPFQEKQMSTQPDFMLEYAQYLATHFTAQGHKNLAVYVESYAALNGRLSRPFIDPNVNLLKESRSLKPKTFILPLDDTIQGL
ncbi:MULTISPECIES: HTTM domain-containing protein [unclassified Leeuwenhoekiella]|uniref:HTTM domain-containing protein n=3 Tax=Leeuwenhoekiella TaxID=283735 RepID=UPI000C56F4CD|nr:MULTISPECIES: HTTM domain-containing protein [unclassified Leeuwenhoekiella]MAW95125.1 HTTM domain-containing protein [Leeuwenhoekiella sp.]MBA79845.1 HTTM domain-containing protein [Leeuwenhoekiella sp.]|tara:strand:+ start:2674 stop:4023 length:1350 start_codon:yes stop_codon:yes gene_type:complete